VAWQLQFNAGARLGGQNSNRSSTERAIAQQARQPNQPTEAKESSMTSKLRVFVGLVLAVYLVESAAITYMVGFEGVLAAVNANAVTRLLAVELGMTLVMIGAWIRRDARERGTNPIGYLIGLAIVGPASPLLYLFRRDSDAVPVREGTRAGAQQLA
jgi:hypothetical protein